MPRLIDHDQRRAELVHAAWRVVTTRGLGALSIREVAAEAGVSAGSLRHLFPTRDQLVIAAAQETVRRAERRVRALPDDLSPQDFALAAVAETLPLDADRRTEFAINLALVAEEPAVPALAGVRRELYDGLRHLCRVLVRRLRPEAPDAVVEDAARRLHVLLDGLALHLFQTPDAGAADTEWALATLRAELAAIART